MSINRQNQYLERQAEENILTETLKSQIYCVHHRKKESTVAQNSTTKAYKRKVLVSC